jgi:hypothetical protein
MERGEDNEWIGISNDLEAWHANLPPSFEPDVVSSTPAVEAELNSDVFSKESWFTNSTCAIAVMYYHMAKMLLIMYEPYSSIAERERPTDWLRTTRKLHHDLSKHASELLAVALAQPIDVRQTDQLKCCSKHIVTAWSLTWIEPTLLPHSSLFKINADASIRLFRRSEHIWYRHCTLQGDV